MRKFHLAMAGLLALGLAAPAPAQGNNDKKPVPVVDGDDILKPGEITGKLGTVAGSTFTLRMEYDTLELRPTRTGGSTGRTSGRTGATTLQRNAVELARLKVQMMAARTPQQRLQVLLKVRNLAAKVQRDQARLAGGRGRRSSPFRVVKEYQDIEIDMSSGIQVRTAFVPAMFDDKGQPRKPTPKERKDLKGPDPSVPGYKADVGALKPDQIVRVTLRKNKDTEDKLQATRIFILTDPDPPARPGKQNN